MIKSNMLLALLILRSVIAEKATQSELKFVQRKFHSLGFRVSDLTNFSTDLFTVSIKTVFKDGNHQFVGEEPNQFGIYTSKKDQFRSATLIAKITLIEGKINPVLHNSNAGLGPCDKFYRYYGGALCYFKDTTYFIVSQNVENSNFDKPFEDPGTYSSKNFFTQLSDLIHNLTNYGTRFVSMFIIGAARLVFYGNRNVFLFSVVTGLQLLFLDPWRVMCEACLIPLIFKTQLKEIMFYMIFEYIFKIASVGIIGGIVTNISVYLYFGLCIYVVYYIINSDARKDSSVRVLFFFSLLLLTTCLQNTVADILCTESLDATARSIYAHIIAFFGFTGYYDDSPIIKVNYEKLQSDFDHCKITNPLARYQMESEPYLIVIRHITTYIFYTLVMFIKYKDARAWLQRISFSFETILILILIYILNLPYFWRVLSITMLHWLIVTIMSTTTYSYEFNYDNVEFEDFRELYKQEANYYNLWTDANDIFFYKDKIFEIHTGDKFGSGSKVSEKQLLTVEHVIGESKELSIDSKVYKVEEVQRLGKGEDQPIIVTLDSEIQGYKQMQIATDLEVKVGDTHEIYSRTASKLSKGRFINVGDEKVSYEASTKPGDSGVPIVRVRNGRREIVGVHAQAEFSTNAGKRIKKRFIRIGTSNKKGNRYNQNSSDEMNDQGRS